MCVCVLGGGGGGGVISQTQADRQVARRQPRDSGDSMKTDFNVQII